MIYIYRPQPSTGARLLAERLTELGHRAIKIGGPVGYSYQPGSTIVCWGAHFRNPPVTALNNIPLSNKLEDALKLREAGVPTIEVSRTRPAVPAYASSICFREMFEGVPIEEAHVMRGDISRVISNLHCWLASNEERPSEEWIGRCRNHVGGNDLLNPLGATPDHWVKKETLTHEYRVHVFDGRSIRAGEKIPRAGVTPHPWVRSWDGGWMIAYSGTSITDAHRNLAKKAVESLGLTFGAVDIGRKADNSLIVLEVNRAPGLEGNTINAYANAIVRYLSAPR